MKLSRLNIPALLSVISVASFAAPAIANDLQIETTGTVTSVTGPGLTLPGFDQLAVGQQVSFIYRHSDVGTTAPGGLSYALNAAGCRLQAGMSTAIAIDDPALNAVQIVNEPNGGTDTLVASMELSGQATARLLITDPSGSVFQSNNLDALTGTTLLSSFTSVDVSAEIFDANTTVQLSFSQVTFLEPGGAIGTDYCDANANSTGVAANISAYGSDIAGVNDVTLMVSDLPANAFGFFITAQMQGLVIQPSGSAGNLCLAGSIGRYVGPGQIQQADQAGVIALTIDLTQTPQPSGFVAAVAGESWNFQAWFRDSSPAGPTSNFTNGLEIPFI